MSVHYKVHPAGSVNTYSTVTTRKLKTHVNTLCVQNCRIYNDRGGGGKYNNHTAIQGCNRHLEIKNHHVI